MNDTQKLNMAEISAIKADCLRRKIGAVVFDENGNCIGTGFNGKPKGMVPCNVNPCDGAHIPAGTGGATGLSTCNAVHAEVRALMMCDVSKIKELFCTKAPCPQCVRMLLDTNCKRIVFKTDSVDQSNKELWVSAGREWIHYA